MNTKPVLLGITSSLRNARWGGDDLVNSLRSIPKKEALLAFLADESERHLENFLAAGRKEGKSFLEIYQNLKKNKGDRGLCNSEVALAAALWSAYHECCTADIDYLSLAEHFPVSGELRNRDILHKKLTNADGILVSGPVYFGDRSSLAQSFIHHISKEPELLGHLRNKVYAGISVGAKRNGGQETTLIYQMMDFLRMNMLAVGNDSSTTAQYGGTCHAGDVGTMHKDNYGIETSMGTGRRIASVLQNIHYKRKLAGPLKILFLVLQDRNSQALSYVQQLAAFFQDVAESTVVNACDMEIMRCIACDFCPVDVGDDDVYRCVIKSSKDGIKKLHLSFIQHDAIVPVTLSSQDRQNVITKYQELIERTRYLRRGDYVLSNMPVSPLTFEEIGFGENYAIRLATSFVRHHTIILNPIAGYLQRGQLINEKEMYTRFSAFIESAKMLTAARIASIGHNESLKYEPVGYILSTDKDKEDERLNKRKSAMQSRHKRLTDQYNTRLVP